MCLIIEDPDGVLVEYQVTPQHLTLNSSSLRDSLASPLPRGWPNGLHSSLHTLLYTFSTSKLSLVFEQYHKACVCAVNENTALGAM